MYKCTRSIFTCFTANMPNLHVISKHYCFQITQELENFSKVFVYILQKSFCRENFKCEPQSQEFEQGFKDCHVTTFQEISLP